MDARGPTPVKQSGFGHGLVFELMVLLVVFVIVLWVLRLFGLSARLALATAAGITLIVPVSVNVAEMVRRARERDGDPS